jgi:serine O-acetyltransferase
MPPQPTSLFARVANDIRVARERDPAARSAVEVVLAYPGFHARQIHRLAHTLHRAGIPLLPRLISQIGRGLTGIEIHPAARLGEGLFIDHGMGVVIGETTIVGNDVTLYQGVTLGGTSRQRAKRHPTIGDGVIIGAGASVIGAVTIGDNVRIGAGAVVIQSVPDHATVVGVPGRVVAIFDPSNDTVETLPDPEGELFGELRARIQQLEGRVAELELRLRQAGQPADDPRPLGRPGPNPPDGR